MAFEKFTARNSRIDNRITVTKSYSIGFPARFYSDNSLKDYKYAVLFWDADSKRIGIHFTNSDDEKSHGFSISRGKENHGGSVVARNFFKHYNINPSDYQGKYEWESADENGLKMFVITLKPVNQA